ncbi:Glycoside hydrolase [Globisporangium polare]
MALSPVLSLLALACAAVASVAQAEIPRACEPPHAAFLFCNASLNTTARVDDLLSRLSLHDKVLMLTARASPKGNVSALGLPEYNWGANCVHGVQSTCGTNCATNFPNPVNIGAMFDPAAVYEMAQVIGWELRALWLEGARENYAAGPHLGLDCWSPNININRDPRWGRNMETPSEDPLVNSLYGVAYTRGLQEGKDPRFLQAAVTLKHWVAYSYEHYAGVDRMEFDAIVSKYDFADTYLPAFRASVVDGNAKGVMCSYNSVNGVPMCANDAMARLLREKLGFDGYITSDSGAIRGIWEKRHYTPTKCDAGLLAIQRGTDVNSGEVYFDCLETLVKEKKLDTKFIDEGIRHSLALRFKLGLFDPIEDQPYWHATPSEVNTKYSQKLSLDMTRKSMVLLQNHNGTLPFAKKKAFKLAVVGPHAAAKEGMMGNYYGQICHGGYRELGCVQTPFEALKAKNVDGSTVYAQGCGMNDTSTAGFSAAVSAAKEADAVVLFLGIDTTIEREAYDRENIELPATQMQLLKAVRKVGKPTVVVLFNGGIIGAEEIILHTDSLVEAFYPGFYGAQALADVLFGDQNPGGKLPVTMYRSNYIDSVAMKSMSMTEYPGRSYRYFKEVPVFPFGFGLSYTKFSLASSGFDVTEKTQSKTRQLFHGMDTKFQIVVSNDGAMAGDEVVFAYFRPLSIDATGPATLLNQQLFAYQRVSLEPQEVVELEFHVKDTALGLYDDAGNLTLFPGYYEIIFSNGVSERLAFLVHLLGEKRVVRPFELDSEASMTAKKHKAQGAGRHEMSSPASRVEATHVKSEALTAVE